MIKLLALFLITNTLQKLRQQVYPENIDKKKRYYRQDFPQLGLKYKDECVIRDNDLLYYLLEYDINQDNMIPSYDKENEQINTVFQLQSVKNHIYYGQYIDDVYEFGLFSENFIQKNEVLGQITGELTLKPQGNNYQFLYPTKYHNQNVWIDYIRESNMFRFINDQGDDSNAEFQYVPYRGQWIILVIAIKDIQIGQQITVNYGDDFWINKQRDQKINNLLYKYQNPFEQQTFQHKDFEQLGLKYIKQPRIQENLKDYIQNFDIMKSNEYKVDKESIQDIQMLLRQQLSNLQNIDDLIYVRFINEDIGYGAFAKKKIDEYIVLGEYTGILESDSQDTTYSWNLSQYYDIKDFELYLNAQNEGNILRFFNDYGENINNCDVTILPHDGRWAVFFITNRVIQEGEELNVSYGDHYWEDKNQANILQLAIVQDQEDSYGEL